VSASRGNVRVTVTYDGDAVEKGTRKNERDLERLRGSGERSLGGLRTAALGAGAALGGALAVGTKKAADAAIEEEKSRARLKAQLDALGISYEKHGRRIDAIVAKQSKLSGLDDENLQDSFTNLARVTGDVDKSLRLVGLAADFARAKNIDVAKAGELVGKVAAGNTGILGRYGIKVREGASAQEALAAMQTKFAGQAEAYGKTTAGSMDRAKVAMENAQAALGARLLPTIAKGATGFANFVAALQRGDKGAVALTATLGALVAGFAALRVIASVVTGLQAAATAVKVLSTAMRANPAVAVATALVALGAALVVAYKRSETFRRVVDGAFRAVRSVVTSVIDKAWVPCRPTWTRWATSSGWPPSSPASATSSRAWPTRFTGPPTE